jgi:hypothetical protein
VIVHQKSQSTFRTRKHLSKMDYFSNLKMNVFNNVFQCSLLTWRVISSFFNKKEVVSMRSSLSTQTLSSWIKALPKCLLICSSVEICIGEIIFSFLDFIMDNVILDFNCTLVWNTVKAECRSEQ